MSAPDQRWHLRVTGVVQGVGFRPFVTGLGRELGLLGHVGNDTDGVFIEAQGPPGALAELVRRVRDDPPPLAAVETVEVQPIPLVVDTADARGGQVPRRFRIVASVAGSGSTSVPPDTAVCEDCLAELRDPADRRFGYPFIACTNCGPRFTITTGLPFDRDNTTMAGFPLCPDCREEYTDPTSRRFHAQPTACPRCGPRLGTSVAHVVRALRSGRVVAIKGVGGYHLACAARDSGAVDRLRARKQRGDKPFAVMAADLPAALRIVRLDPAAEALLTSPVRPIVIAPARDEALAARVAPRTGTLGVMLPYTGLHHLLFDAGAPELLVMTSANLADEPICTEAPEAEARLAGIADVFCHHDRPITVACDDSVTRVVGDAAQPVRRSRGYAPTPLRLPHDAAPMVAVGGELKATACVASGRRAWLSQHIGDTANLETLDMLSRTVDTLGALQRVTPEVIVSDAHPGYLSRGWAARRAAAIGGRHVLVQHHHAHLAALLVEHRVPPDEPVLGLVMDGTGYGPDATIWGGELLLGGYASVVRVGYLRPVLLPGGDAAIRHPARSGLAHLWAAGLPLEGTASATSMAAADRELLARMLASGSHCTPTTSMGRLFDAVASLLGVRQDVDFEAQAAIELEALAAAEARAVGTAGLRGGSWAWGSRPVVRAERDGTLVLDPSGWIGQAAADRAAGVAPGRSALAFHLALAEALTQAAETICAGRGLGTVGLTGGVFANAVLTGACQAAMRRAGLTVLVHGVLPANDAGLAVGQVAVAAARGAGGPAPA